MLYLFLLCIIQGVVECLPISSSAHLYFLSILGGYTQTTRDVEVALHLGSLIALLIFLRQPLRQIIKGSLNSIKTQRLTTGCVMGLIIICATLPAIIVGFVVKRYIHIPETILSIGVISIIFGTLLFWAETVGANTKSKITLKDAFIIGCAQIAAFIPGASRLGSCLTAARFLNIQRWQATEFSFLLAIPTILGAVVLTGIDILHAGEFYIIKPLWPAIIATALVSLVVLNGLKWYASRYSYGPIAIYRIIIGIILVYLAYVKL
jgi:undecaprenyl-diphosphatase